MVSPTPRTIVIASESFYPVISGVAIMTERLAHFMAKQGHKVVVITPSRNHRMYQEYRRGYTIQRIPSWPNPFRKVQRVTFFPNQKVKRVLNKLQPDIVHLHDPWVTSIAVARYCRKNNIPVMVTHHFSYDFLRAYVRNLKPLHKGMQIALEKTLFLPLYNTCDMLTVPTETMRKAVNEIEDLQITPRVVSNGVDLTRFKTLLPTTGFLEKHHLPASVPIILCVSRLDPEKNLSMYLEALHQLLKKKVPFHALMVGDGGEREELEAQAEELGLQKHLTWIKKIDNQSKELVQMYQASSVFCIPSPIETESMVTMEAMAGGLPIVAANRKALKELVVNDDNGYLLHPDSSTSWAEKLAELLQNPSKRTEMGKASQKRVAPRDISVTLPIFESLYEELLSGSTAN